MLEQWQTLFLELEVTNQGREILNEEEFLRFETQDDVPSPVGYKEFCQIFGTGSFGNFVRVFCPSPHLVRYSTLSLESIKEKIECFPSENIERDNQLRNLLNNGFVFGNDFGANIAVWDLRTYSETDQSYDIYWIDIDSSDENLHQIGRDFFEFVCNFCLGRGTYELPPEDKRPHQMVYFKLSPSLELTRNYQ
jgi:RNAse (barnase) inhibitor barstar